MLFHNFVLLAKDIFHGSFAIQSIFTILLIIVQFFPNKRILCLLLLIIYTSIPIAYLFKVIIFNTQNKIFAIKLCYTMIYSLINIIIIFLCTDGMYIFKTKNLHNACIFLIIVGWGFVLVKCVLYFVYEIAEYEEIDDEIDV